MIKKNPYKILSVAQIIRLTERFAKVFCVINIKCEFDAKLPYLAFVHLDENIIHFHSRIDNYCAYEIYNIIFHELTHLKLNTLDEKIVYGYSLNLLKKKYSNFYSLVIDSYKKRLDYFYYAHPKYFYAIMNYLCVSN